MNWQNNRVMVALGFYLSLAIMMGIGIFSFVSSQDLMRYNELLNRSLRVHEVLEEVWGFVLEAESSQRGYILTGSERFLGSYRKEVNDIPVKLTVLRNLTGERPRSQHLINALEPLINRKLALLQERISAMETGNREAAIRSVKSEAGLQLTDKISLLVRDLEKEEAQVLSERKAGVESMRRRALLARVIGGPLSFGILILIFYCLKREIAARRRTAEALHLSEERLRVFMEHSPAISFMKDMEGKYVFVNGLIEQLSSRKPGELVGKTDSELWPPEAAQQLQALDRLVFAEEKAVEIMAALPDREGNSRDFLIYEFPIPNHQGKRILGGVAVDITQRRAAEAALQRAAKEFQMVVDNIPAVVFKGYVDGTVDFFDDRVERLTGYAREEFEAHRRPWQDLIFPEDLATAKASFVRALKGSGLYVREYRIRTKTEGVLWIQERSCIVRQPDGKVDYVSGVFFDITARKRGEDALRESEARYRNIFDNAVEGIFQSTVQGGYISVNPAMAEMFGHESPEELLEAVTDIEHQVYVDPARREDFQRLIERDGFVKNFEYQVYRKDHSTLWISENTRAVRDETGNLLYYEGFAENITARKSAEMKLQRANRALKTLSLVNQTLVYARDEYEFLQNICKIITAVGGYRLAWIALARQDDTKAVSPLVYAGIETGLLEGLNISWADDEKGRGPTGTAIRTNQTIIVKDVVADPTFAPWRDKILSRGLASAISLPLPLDGAPWGALTIYAPEANAFDSDEVGLLDELAQDIQYGIASLRAREAQLRAEAALRESEEKFRGLFNTSPDVVAQTDLNLNFLMVNNMAEPLFGYENAAQLIGTNFLDLVDSADYPRVLEDSKKLLKTGTLRNAQYTFVRKDGTSFPGETSATVTLDAAGAPKTFTGTIRDITERKQAEESLKESYERLRASLEGTVTALSAVVESKDPYTAGHQRRVTHLACAIAREMGLSQDQAEGIRVMGYLHDIGKIAVPAEILSRPGKINEFEFNLIKQHPISGFDILKQIAFPWPVAQAVLQHHERLDGSGYPSGITGSEIILEARVLAVADVVEAMASHRPYRPAMSIERALEEIAQNKGTLYDHEVVEACVRLFREENFEFE